MLNIENYKDIKKNLRVKLMAANGNESKLANRPYRKIEDMAMVYKILVDMDEETYTSIQVTYSIFEKWGITEQELFDDAMIAAYSVSSAYILPIEQMIGINPEEGQSNTFVVSSGGVNGAWIIFFPGMMKIYARSLKVNGYYVLPSSIHEMLLIPEEYDDHEAEELQKMVAEINVKEVAPKDRLTDSVYYYDLITDTFRRVA